MQLTTDIIINGTGCSFNTASAWMPSLQAACDKYEINTLNRVAAFLANVGIESESLTRFSENLNYSAQGLANTWPSRYATSATDKVKTPNALANQIARNPELIANNTYANRLGNGDVASGDGWKYRGQGPIQITGKENITNCLKAIGQENSDPSLLQQPELGALSAAWFFNTRNCNTLADKGQISEIIRQINGALPNDANQGQLRIDRFRKVCSMK